MSGLFRPGEAVTLRGVSEALGTSVMPVREAVRRLVSERALEMPTSRSIRVPPMSRESFADLCRVRSIVEGEAAACAAERATPEALVKIERANERFVTHARSGDVKAMLAHNRDFHFRIYELAGNPLLLSIIESLWLQGGPYLHLLLEAPAGEKARMNAGDGEHSRIIGALRAGDAEGARRALAADIFGAAELYMEQFDRRDASSQAGPKGLIAAHA